MTTGTTTSRDLHLQHPILHLPHLSITEENWDAGLRLLLEHVRPSWQFANVGQRLFTEGITNKMVAMYLGGKLRFDDDVILVRIYGEKTELIIDRQAELFNMKLLHANGFCQPPIATFGNGLCYGYAHGDVPNEDMLRDPTVGLLIARELASLHCLKVDPALYPDQSPSLFRAMRRLLELGPDDFGEPERQARLRSVFPDKAALRDEVAELESHILRLNCPVVFSHNDTLAKNFVYNRRNQRVHLIDFEYCAFNYLPYDIANHFNEFAGVATIDHSRYPSREFQLPWLRAYLSYRDDFLGNAASSQGDDDNGRDLNSRVDELYSQVAKFSLTSHLFWSLWSLVQARYSTIDFDFLEYAISRFSEYLARKSERLAV